MVDFGIVNASGGSGEVWLALVVVKARVYKVYCLSSDEIDHRFSIGPIQ